jgi:hypothetical protein
MKNTRFVVHNASEPVLILKHAKNYAIICVQLVVFALTIMYDKRMKTVHVLKKMNVKYFFEILLYIFSMMFFVIHLSIFDKNYSFVFNMLNDRQTFE